MLAITGALNVAHLHEVIARHPDRKPAQHPPRPYDDFESIITLDPLLIQRRAHRKLPTGRIEGAGLTRDVICAIKALRLTHVRRSTRQFFTKVGISSAGLFFTSYR